MDAPMGKTRRVTLLSRLRSESPWSSEGRSSNIGILGSAPEGAAAVDGWVIVLIYALEEYLLLVHSNMVAAYLKTSILKEAFWRTLCVTTSFDGSLQYLREVMETLETVSKSRRLIDPRQRSGRAPQWLTAFRSVWQDGNARSTRCECEGMLAE